MMRWNAERWTWSVVIIGASLIGLLSARPFAGGWNDGSRLATVESLVDRHTLAIDDSIFVNVASVDDSPYECVLMRDRRRPAGMLGTFDKLRIDGHWYSDKSPVPAFLLAILYQLLQWTTGLRAALHPQAFCYWMTVLSSGIAYLVAIAGMHHLGKLLRLPPRTQLGVTASFAVATLALAYTRYVNNHILLLGVAVVLLVGHARLAEQRPARWGTLSAIGSLAGFAYTIDLGMGPPLWLGSLVLVAWRTRSRTSVIAVGLAALPWLVLHHSVNYAVGGTIKPANAVAEYLDWPHSPFTTNLTGQWNHDGFGKFVGYAVQLLAGKKGFLGHNLPLLLALPAVCLLWRSRWRYRPEMWFCATVSGAVWLMYALGSTNQAGACCSIRWFVPLIGLGYFVLIVLLREAPGATMDFAILSIGGAALMASAWPGGPWRLTLLPAHWPILGLTLATWAVYRWRVGWQWRSLQSNDQLPNDAVATSAL